MSILAVIPTRRDSKRCPGKNKRRLGRIPLFLWTQSILWQFNKDFNKICMATNDKDIEKLGKCTWLDFIKLPEHIASETASEWDFLNYTIEWYKERGQTFDDVAIFYPTTPFKTIETIKLILEQWQENRQLASQLRTVKKIRWEPEKLWDVDTEEYILSLKTLYSFHYHQIYKQVPYLYIYKTSVLNKVAHYDYLNCAKFVLTNPVESHDINTAWDWWIAEQIVKEGLNE